MLEYFVSIIKFKYAILAYKYKLIFVLTTYFRRNFKKMLRLLVKVLFLIQIAKFGLNEAARAELAPGQISSGKIY
jgi:hypothetical protein